MSESDVRARGRPAMASGVTSLLTCLHWGLFLCPQEFPSLDLASFPSPFYISCCRFRPRALGGLGGTFLGRAASYLHPSIVMKQT